MRWTHGIRARLRLLFRGPAEERMDEEMLFHLEMEAEKNVRAGMGPEEARRLAAVAFGGLEAHREEMRQTRTLAWTSGLSLDVRLGIRMLRKHLGLTLVGGLGLAIAIAAAAIFEGSLGAATAPISIEGGDRIVALEVWDAEIRNQEGQFLYDYGGWEEEVRSIESLGAYRTVSRNLIVPGGSTEPVRLAEITSSGFRVVATPPLLGRPLLESDELEGAPSVAVLSHEVWQSRFGGEPEVIGREVRLGTAVHTVVGVMPEGFGFPLGHRLWVPLRLEPSEFAPREGPSISAFGRLSSGVSIDEAQAELTALGDRTAAVLPETHRHLRPRVIQYGPHLLDDLEGYEVPLSRGLIALLLLIIAVNVSVLVFARTATRAGEITIRGALGASRKRIITQFFAEGLVLAAASAGIGLAVAALVLRRLEDLMDGMLAPMGGLPFWIDFHLSGRAVLFSAALATLAAVIVGVFPALRATGTRLDSALRALGGATGMRLGRTWSFLIVAQVAFTVALLPGTIYFAVDFARFGMMDPGFAADEYLAAVIVMDGDVENADPAGSEAVGDSFDARYAALVTELERRLESEPEVVDVAVSASFPADEPAIRFEVEGVAATGDAVGGAPGHPARYNRVDAGFFDTFEVDLLSGRGFEPGDFSPAAAAVIVNRAFVRDVLGGASALGQRIRFAQGYRSGGVMRVPAGLEPDRRYEIVGVVRDLPAIALEPGRPVAGVYRPLEAGSMYPLRVSIRTRGEPAALASRVRELSAAIDPTLQTSQLEPLSVILDEEPGAMRMGALGLGLLTGSVLLLSAAGIYALMSFTVTRRRREIGIRSALGAHPRRILASLFRRAALQLGLGAGLGLAVAIGMNWLTEGDLTGGEGGIVLPSVAAIMLVVGLLATIGPARRGLGVQPMEALREE